MALRKSLIVSLAVLAVLVVTVSCGDDRTGGPTGEPQAVVDAAPDATLAAGRARFEAAAPDDQRAGELDFSDPASATAEVEDHPELALPGAMVDLVRGAIAAESYGGAAVRGASTFRYDTVINVERAVAETPAERREALEALAAALGVPAFYADVWVDGDGRLRRVQVPLEKTTERPEARSKRIPALVTVDYFDFPAG